MKRAAKQKPADPRTERALRFLLPLLQHGGAMRYEEIRRQARANGIKEEALFRASNEGGVVFITEAGKPVLWELSGLNPYGRPTLRTQSQRNPYERAVSTDESVSEVTSSDRESSRSGVGTYGQSQTSETPGNETVVDPSIRRPASRSTGLASSLGEETLGGQMVLWVNFAGELGPFS